MSKDIPQVLKGFRDYLPKEAKARKQIISKITQVFERFGFVPMDTPSLESFELFQGKLGEEEKLMYKFQDLGEREVALRYDLTVPLARVLAENNNLPKPFKRYQIGNVWRADKPQKGRYREFIQCDIDIVGSNSLLADAEVVAIISEAFKILDIGEVTIKFNNRKIIDEALATLGVKETANFLRLIDKLDKVGESKTAEAIKAQGFKIDLNAYRTEMKKAGKKFVDEFESLLSSLGVKNFGFNPTLARGLDYYTGTIFEFTLKDKPEFGSIAGGGRYDSLIGKISGKETPAVGGSIGLDRLFAALFDSGKLVSESDFLVMVFNLDENLASEYLKMVTTLRQAGINTELYYEPAKMDKQFKYAESKNAKVAVIFGAEEAKAKKVNLKNLQAKEQVTVDLKDLVVKVKSMI
ncbi:histidine--tRNA ligase [Candidatus Woesebacteria bacterium RIFCSPHIGHO2_01_FULL_44_21]|uniref:Histidine--tRNA ligase n=1 Tax=Candidatus Woesebacteria bacterium RIFCSPHIGHO2_01_FULL_44_21 TaxID=1802503 RepID=A0A1F7Z000_9BACT|nr:MAG: histidine--tRNA ligase [Candidatus Woesebacteria bacterium RIFCSPHIGHO2_01_FULL_44_21]